MHQNHFGARALTLPIKHHIPSDYSAQPGITPYEDYGRASNF
jgi:hypothetical protein